MKTILDYLNERKDIAWNNRLCYSKTYGMDTPKEGKEDNFWECVRNCEIVDYLIDLVEKDNDKTDNANNRKSQEYTKASASSKGFIPDPEHDPRKPVFKNRGVHPTQNQYHATNKRTEHIQAYAHAFKRNLIDYMSNDFVKRDMLFHLDRDMPLLIDNAIGWVERVFYKSID